MSKSKRNRLLNVARNEYRRTVRFLKRTGGAFLPMALQNAKTTYRLARRTIRAMTHCENTCADLIALQMRNVGVSNH